MIQGLPDRIGPAARVDHPDPGTIAYYLFRDDAGVVAVIDIKQIVPVGLFQVKSYKVATYIGDGDSHILDSWIGDEQSVQENLVKARKTLSRYHSRLSQALQGLPDPMVESTNPTLWDRLNDG